MINVELARKVRDQIADHPETYDQSTWAMETDCGTTYCVAGWALALSPGWTIQFRGHGVTHVRRPNGMLTYIADAAAQLLGINAYIDPITGGSWDPLLLSEGRASNSDLFDADNTREGVLAALDRIITAGELERETAP